MMDCVYWGTMEVVAVKIWLPCESVVTVVVTLALDGLNVTVPDKVGVR